MRKHLCWKGSWLTIFCLLCAACQTSGQVDCSVLILANDLKDSKNGCSAITKFVSALSGVNLGPDNVSCKVEAPVSVTLSIVDISNDTTASFLETMKTQPNHPAILSFVKNLGAGCESSISYIVQSCFPRLDVDAEDYAALEEDASKLSGERYDMDYSNTPVLDCPPVCRIRAEMLNVSTGAGLATNRTCIQYAQMLTSVLQPQNVTFLCDDENTINYNTNGDYFRGTELTPLVAYFNVQQDAAVSYLTSFQTNDSVQAAANVLDAFNFDCRDAYINFTIHNAFSKSSATCEDLSTNQTIRARGCIGGECKGPMPLPFYYVNTTINATTRPTEISASAPAGVADLDGTITQWFAVSCINGSRHVARTGFPIVSIGDASIDVRLDVSTVSTACCAPGNLTNTAGNTTNTAISALGSDRPDCTTPRSINIGNWFFFDVYNEVRLLGNTTSTAVKLLPYDQDTSFASTINYDGEPGNRVTFGYLTGYDGQGVSGTVVISSNGSICNSGAIMYFPLYSVGLDVPKNIIRLTWQQNKLLESLSIIMDTSPSPDIASASSPSVAVPPPPLVVSDAEPPVAPPMDPRLAPVTLQATPDSRSQPRSTVIGASVGASVGAVVLVSIAAVTAWVFARKRARARMTTDKALKDDQVASGEGGNPGKADSTHTTNSSLVDHTNLDMEGSNDDGDVHDHGDDGVHVVVTSGRLGLKNAVQSSVEAFVDDSHLQLPMLPVSLEAMRNAGHDDSQSTATDPSFKTGSVLGMSGRAPRGTNNNSGTNNAHMRHGHVRQSDASRRLEASTTCSSDSASGRYPSGSPSSASHNMGRHVEGSVPSSAASQREAPPAGSSAVMMMSITSDSDVSSEQDMHGENDTSNHSTAQTTTDNSNVSVTINKTIHEKVDRFTHASSGITDTTYDSTGAPTTNNESASASANTSSTGSKHSNRSGVTGGTGGSSMASHMPVRQDVDEQIAYDDMHIDQNGLLGAGAEGSVYRATWKGQAVAVKVFTHAFTDGKFMGMDPVNEESLQREFALLSRLSHPNVVHLFGGCLKPPRMFIVEELMASTLSTVIHGPSRPALTQAVQLLLGITRGLQYLHSVGIVHRDLKPANVLLSTDGAAKISDFGLARCRNRTYLSTTVKDAGTVAYMAPECFNPDMGGITAKSDIFSLGMIFWELLTGEHPWPGLNNMAVIYRVAIQGQRNRIPEDHELCPPGLATLITACWSATPHDRPTCDEVVAHLESLQRALAGK